MMNSIPTQIPSAGVFDGANGCGGAGGLVLLFVGFFTAFWIGFPGLT